MRSRAGIGVLLLLAAVCGPAWSAPAVVSAPEDLARVATVILDGAEPVARHESETTARQSEIAAEVEKAAVGGEDDAPAEGRDTVEISETETDVSEIPNASHTNNESTVNGSPPAPEASSEALTSEDTSEPSSPDTNSTETVASSDEPEDATNDTEPVVASSRQARLLGFDTSKLFTVPSWLQGLMGGDDDDSSADNVRRPGPLRRRGPLRRQGFIQPQGQRRPFRPQPPLRHPLRPQPPLRSGPVSDPTRRGPDSFGVVQGLQPPSAHDLHFQGAPHTNHHVAPDAGHHVPHQPPPQEVYHVHHHTHVHVPSPDEGVLAILPSGGPVAHPGQEIQPFIRPVGLPRHPEDPVEASANAPWRWGGDSRAPDSAVFVPESHGPPQPVYEPGVKPCNACGGAWIPCNGDCDGGWSWQSTGDPGASPSGPGVLFPGPGRTPSRPAQTTSLFTEDVQSSNVLFPGPSDGDELATEASVISSVIAEETPVRRPVFVTEAPRVPLVTVTALVTDAPVTAEPPAPVTPEILQPQRPSEFPPRPTLLPGSLVTEAPFRPNQLITEGPTRKPEVPEVPSEPPAPVTERPTRPSRPPRPTTQETTTERPQRRRPTARPSVPFWPHRRPTTTITTTTTTTTTTPPPTTTTTTTTTTTPPPTTAETTTTTTRPPPTQSFTERLPGLDSIPIV